VPDRELAIGRLEIYQYRAWLQRDYRVPSSHERSFYDLLCSRKCAIDIATVYGALKAQISAKIGVD
jgi:hypothetical protein